MSFSGDFDTSLAAARTGAEWAWRNLYRDLAPVVLRYFRARGAPEPEDLTGDVFVQIVRKLDQFAGGEDDFRRWVITIAHHRLIDSARSRARRPVDPAPNEVLTSAGGSADPEHEALTRIASVDVQRALKALSLDQQDVVFLRLIEGLSVNEVAAALGKRPGAIKALQVRALGALRRNLPQGVSL